MSLIHERSHHWLLGEFQRVHRQRDALRELIDRHVRDMIWQPGQDGPWLIRHLDSVFDTRELAEAEYRRISGF